MQDGARPNGLKVQGFRGEIPGAGGAQAGKKPRLRIGNEGGASVRLFYILCYEYCSKIIDDAFTVPTCNAFSCYLLNFIK